MRFRSAMSGSILLLALFLVPLLRLNASGWSAATPQPATLPTQPAAVDKSVSGTISSIGDASFTVDVKKEQNTIRVPFLIDEGTKIDGKLEVGKDAQVDFRTEDGNNIAMNVRVRQAGIAWR